MDRVLLSASPSNIQACIRLALQYSLGIEVMAFAYPDLLDGNWQDALADYKQMLHPIRGMITMHGPFMDMAPGSPDKQINKVVRERYQHGIRVASELGAEVIVFHANFIASIGNLEYRYGWHQRNVEFWGPMAEYAAEHGVTIAVENMWEFDPDIIADVLREVDHPNLRACLDVGHAHLFSIFRRDLTFEDWLKAFGPWLVHTHMNNNDGSIDVHRGLHEGVLDYTQIMRRIRQMPKPPSITLEIDRVSDMKISLSYMELMRPTGHLRNLVLSEYTTPPDA